MFPLPEEFVDFVSRYFNLLEALSENTRQNKPDKCIQTMRELTRVNESLEDIFVSSPLESRVKFDYTTISLALYLDWIHNKSVKSTDTK